MFKLKNLFSRKGKKQEQIQLEAQNIDKIAIDDFYSTCEKEGLIVEEITIDDSNFPKVENGSKDAEDVISGAAQIYKPRLTAPSKTDKNWIHYTAGGYNYCIKINGNSCLPNCVGFAWGRWRELLGKKHNLSCSDAERWYGKNDGYKRGKTPKIGAVICWRKGRADTDSDGMGHVAIVEQVNQDGSVLCSNSAYYSTYFWLSTHKPPYSFGGYTFQGFIYNPIEYKQGRYIDEDGEFGFESTVSMQMWMGTEADGEISNQLSFNKEYFPAITTCKWGKGGSLLIKTFQAYLKKCGYNPSLTGYIDKKTVIAWQTWLVKTQGFKIDIDGYFGPQSAKAMQRFLNIVLNR